MSTSLQLFQPKLPLGSLDAYLQQINQIPLLTLEEERDLAERLRDKGDLKAAQQLILSHLRYVARVAKGYLGYGLPLADLIQEGTIGLMKAVKRFDPAMGVRLVSFAVHWIKAEIHEYIIKNWRIVKIATTKAQRKLFFNLRTAKKRLGWFTREEMEAVAQDLGVAPEEVQRMEARLNAQDIGFDLQDSESDHGSIAPVEYLEDHSGDPALSLEADNWQMRAENRLGMAWQQLDERSRYILERRWLIEDKSQKATLQELADTFQISLERVRQIEKNAIEQLKEVVGTEEAA